MDIDASGNTHITATLVIGDSKLYMSTADEGVFTRGSKERFPILNGCAEFACKKVLVI